MTDPADDAAPEPLVPAEEPAAPEPSASGVRSEAASPAGRRSSRPNLSIERIAVSRDHGGYVFRIEPPDLAKLRELPGARGKTDEELGAEFLAAQADRLVAAIAGDLPTPASIRVLIDPYSRQVFLAHEDRVRGILSF
ncbi:MAG TPA: hypothetical protein VIY96_04910 [Thermoanaerobaculia bacterium]